MRSWNYEIIGGGRDSLAYLFGIPEDACIKILVRTKLIKVDKNGNVIVKVRTWKDFPLKYNLSNVEYQGFKLRVAGGRKETHFIRIGSMKYFATKWTAREQWKMKNHVRIRAPLIRETLIAKVSDLFSGRLVVPILLLP